MEAKRFVGDRPRSRSNALDGEGEAGAAKMMQFSLFKIEPVKAGPHPCVETLRSNGIGVHSKGSYVLWQSDHIGGRYYPETDTWDVDPFVFGEEGLSALIHYVRQWRRKIRK